ncbi:MAG TPA: type II toxin-antitoxin system VapC family toxin [Solirubrobacterales bacterium]|jgi:ribonuclease VapC|nr:type II toxin-antitoxin system VapC family toxin [Solirubrobacterales bacterium]
MILDSSAVIAVLREEPGHEQLQVRLEQADVLEMGAPTVFETNMVLVRRFGEAGGVLIERFLEDWEVQVLPFGEQHLSLAMDGFARYGKGRHRARLNYGDCMTYATARVADQPLLFIGDDFARTDIAPA